MEKGLFARDAGEKHPEALADPCFLRLSLFCSEAGARHPRGRGLVRPPAYARRSLPVDKVSTEPAQQGAGLPCPATSG